MIDGGRAGPEGTPERVPGGVKAGETVVITEHGKTIGRIEPQRRDLRHWRSDAHAALLAKASWNGAASAFDRPMTG